MLGRDIKPLMLVSKETAEAISVIKLSSKNSSPVSLFSNQAKDAAVLLHLCLVSSLTWHLNGSKTEQLGDDGPLVLFWILRVGTLLWSGTNGGFWRCWHGHPLWLIAAVMWLFYRRKQTCMYRACIYIGIISLWITNSRCCWPCCLCQQLLCS